MTSITHIRMVTPKHLADWLEKRTTTWPRRIYPIGDGQYCLQKAQAEGSGTDPTRIVFRASFFYPSEDDPSKTKVRDVGEGICFDLIPLDTRRTEITTKCIDSSEVQCYCAELLAEIEKRWPAENTQPEFRDSTNAPKTTTLSREQITFALLVSGFVLALFACIAAWLVVPQVQEAIQSFGHGVIPTLTPTFVSPTATP